MSKINVIGLGKTGCRVSESFSQLGNYSSYFVDVGLEKTKNTRGFPDCKTPENYEKKCPSMSYFLKNVRGKTLFVIDGSEIISASSLKILEHTDRKNTSVLYIQPDVVHMSGPAAENERVVYHVLQEYVRSGAIGEIYLMNLVNINDSLGDVSLIDFKEVVSETISSTINFINYFENTDPVFETQGHAPNQSRICTIGFVNSESGREKLFFPLKGITNKHYFYGINEEELRSDNELLNKIRNQVNQMKGKDVQASYSVYPTKYDKKHIICLARTPEIQWRKK